MLLAQILILIGLVAGIMIAYFFLRKKEKIIKLVFLILSIILVTVFFVRYMSGTEQIRTMFARQGALFGWNNEFITVISMLALWLNITCVLVLTLAPYFKLNFLTHFIKFFILPCSLFLAITLKINTMGVVGASVYNNTASFVTNLRAILISVEIALIICMSVITFLQNGNFKSTKKEWLTFLYVLPLLLICTMPGYTLEVIIGNSSLTQKIKSFSQLHRIIIYFSLIIPLGIYFLLKNKDAKTIKFSMLFLSLATLITFSFAHKFDSFASPISWPLHLCNTAMYIVPLCIVFKWEKLFYFTVFINVLGAFFAILIPSYDINLNLFSTRVVTFYINHYIAFFMPFLMIALKMYPRPKLKHFIYSMVAFLFYFLFILVINAWFSNYGTVDFFFLNSDFIVSKLGSWAEDLRLITWNLHIKDLTLTFYPLYQALFFLVYVVLGLAVWFIYAIGYKVADGFGEMARIQKSIKMERLALESRLKGRSKEEPVNKNGTNKLIIKDFCKKYGNSKKFAVENANLEVKSGEIFGFLGPNGAGKSTIIKSVVGIQSLTSGKVEVCGYDITSQPVMAKRQIGFVPDHYAFYEKLTGREYINYIADLYEVSKELRTERINNYLEIFNLEESFDNPIKTYSHGMKQKIAIMSALVHEPKLWILDEPLTGLDPTSIFQVKECMKKHVEKGNIVFFSSHIIDVVEKLCSRIAVIKDGKIVAVKTMEEIESEYETLEKFYLNIIENK